MKELVILFIGVIQSVDKTESQIDVIEGGKKFLLTHGYEDIEVNEAANELTYKGYTMSKADKKYYASCPSSNYWFQQSEIEKAVNSGDVSKLENSLLHVSGVELFLYKVLSNIGHAPDVDILIREKYCPQKKNNTVLDMSPCCMVVTEDVKNMSDSYNIYFDIFSTNRKWRPVFLNDPESMVYNLLIKDILAIDDSLGIKRENYVLMESKDEEKHSNYKYKIGIFDLLEGKFSYFDKSVADVSISESFSSDAFLTIYMDKLCKFILRNKHSSNFTIHFNATICSSDDKIEYLRNALMKIPNIASEVESAGDYILKVMDNANTKPDSIKPFADEEFEFLRKKVEDVLRRIQFIPLIFDGNTEAVLKEAKELAGNSSDERVKFLTKIKYI